MPIFNQMRMAGAASFMSGGYAFEFTLPVTSSDMVQPHKDDGHYAAAWPSTDLVSGISDGSQTGLLMQNIAYGGGKWVACGGSGNIWTSSTISGTWATATTPNTAFINAVAYDGTGRWVAVGNAVSGVSTIWTTTDPTGTWVAAGLSDLDSTGDGDEHLNDVTHDGTRWIVVGNDAVILTAVDPTLAHTDGSGNGWTTVTRKTLTSNGKSLYKVHHENISGTDYYVAVGQHNSNTDQIFYATDPTEPTSTNGGWQVNNTHTFTDNVQCIGYSNGYWVFGTNFDFVDFKQKFIRTADITSTTGGDWSLIGTNLGSKFTRVINHKGIWYAFTDSNSPGYFMKSIDDGASWTSEIDLGYNTRVRGAAIDSNDDLVLASQDGAKLVTTANTGTSWEYDGTTGGGTNFSIFPGGSPGGNYGTLINRTGATVDLDGAEFTVVIEIDSINSHDGHVTPKINIADELLDFGSEVSTLEFLKADGNVITTSDVPGTFTATCVNSEALTVADNGELLIYLEEGSGNDAGMTWRVKSFSWSYD